MKEYYITEFSQGYKWYWSTHGKYGYWSRFTDEFAIKNRRSYDIITAKIIQFFMWLEGTKTKLEVKEDDNSTK